MKIKELLNGINYELIGNGEVNVNAVMHIAENSSPDSAYICLCGAKNGHNYIDVAIANGAVVVIAEIGNLNDDIIDGITKKGVTVVIVENTREAYSIIAGNFYGNTHKKLKIIGIVGTNGKTTTAHLVYHILNKNNVPCGIIGTLGAKSSDGATMDTYLTTPDPMVLYGILNRMVQSGDKYVVMELSAHSIALEKCAAIQFYALAFTNLSRDHLDYFASMEEYESVKHSIFIKSNALNIINIDDISGQKLVLKLKGKECVTCSLNRQKSGLNENNTDFCKVCDTFDTKDIKGYITADYSAIFNAPNKIEIISPHNKSLINPLYGRFNAYNLLLAISICSEIGVNIDSAINSLSSFDNVNGRFVLYECKGIKLIVDFAHTPDGLSNLLSAAREITVGKLSVVFGAGGDRDKGKRAEMGRVAGQLSDKIFLTRDNPRSEQPISIINDILLGIDNHNKVVYIELDRFKAIKLAFDNANIGDTIVIAGKGHENFIEEKGVKTHYSDIESVEKIIRENAEI